MKVTRGGFALILSLLTLFSTLSCTEKEALEQIQWSEFSGSKAEKDKSLEVLNSLDLEEKDIIQINQGSIEWKRQNIQGFIVLNSWVKVGKNPSLQEDVIGASVVPHPQKVVTPHSFKSSKRQSQAFAQIRKLYNLNETDPIVPALWSSPAGIHPVWQFYSLGPDSAPYENILDGFNFKLLRQTRVGSHFEKGSTVSALVFPKGPKMSDLKEVDLLDLNFGEKLANSVLTVSSAAGENVKVSGQPLIFEINEERFDQVEVFYLLQNAHAWFQKHLGWTWAGVLSVETAIGHPQKSNAAFYYNNKIRLGSGDGTTYDRIPHDPSIVVHESAHALIDRMTGLSFEGESGSINEALADFLTACHLNSPKMGEVAYRLGDFKRNIDNTKTWQELSGKLYGDSLVISGFLWELRSQLGQETVLKLTIETLRQIFPNDDLNAFSKKIQQTASAHLSKDSLNKFQALVKKRGWIAL